MTIKKGFCFLLCICVLFAVVTGCSSKKSGQAITYNLEEEPVTLDPQIADDYSSRIVIMALYEGLTRLDENNQVSRSCTALGKQLHLYLFYFLSEGRCFLVRRNTRYCL